MGDTAKDFTNLGATACVAWRIGMGFDGQFHYVFSRVRRVRIRPLAGMRRTRHGPGNSCTRWAGYSSRAPRARPQGSGYRCGSWRIGRMAHPPGSGPPSVGRRGRHARCWTKSPTGTDQGSPSCRYRAGRSRPARPPGRRPRPRRGWPPSRVPGRSPGARS